METPSPGESWRELLCAPSRVPEARKRVGEAIWLYMHLVTVANTTSRICRTLPTLARDVHVSEGTINEWLGKLVQANLVEVQTPAPYLVMKLRFWPSSREESHKSSEALTRAHAPGSSKQLQQKKTKQAASSEDGGPGEGEAALQEVLSVLGAGNEAEIRELIARYPAALVRKALRRVERTPDAQIRKSRLALFRFLVVKFAVETNAQTPQSPA